jgi:predicted acyltransferase
MTTPILPERIASIDVMRGIAVLVMVFALAIPPGILSDWMYFAQTPPPAHDLEPALSGITWVDLIFPIFLFMLGVVIPFDLPKRRGLKHPWLNQVLWILQRTGLLGVVAIMYRSFNTKIISDSFTPHSSVIGLLGFITISALLIRPLPSWNKKLIYTIRTVGVIGALLMFWLIRYPDGSGFSFNRTNSFLVILMNSYFWGAVLWMFSQNSIMERLGLLGILMAMRLAHPYSGWIQDIWNWTPLPGLYRFEFSQFLFIVIPGTIIGDCFLHNDWTQIEMEPFKIHRFHDRVLVIGLLALIIIPAILIGLKYRLVVETTLFAVAILAIANYVFHHLNTNIEKFLRKLFRWGSYWLIIGLISEPYEGGIKRISPTLSYFLITGSLANFLLIATVIFTDVFDKHHLVEPIRDNGRNSLLTYLSLGFLIMPILNLTGIRPLIANLTPGPWLGAIRALFYTFLVAVVVRFFTRRNYFLRV